MRLLKPAWVTHNGKFSPLTLRTRSISDPGRPIFSVDIHPDGSRFATGGQGEDTAGMIIVWNMAPVRSERDEKDNSVPRLLCQMDNHLACVNCVRWSRSGRYLSSGGDDKLVMIWQTSKYGVGGTTFGSDSKIVESWRPVHTLRGHTGDVLDVAWSPGDVWFASCSIDNTVIVWNAEKFPEQVAVLRGHTGLVKGVTWDPVGSYLASQSDDKSLRVWRTRDWQQEACITDPFTECGGTTHVLRCDWSPDGTYVVSAHAMNNSGPTAQIVERGDWKTALDFVGHRKAVTVVRFNPDILSKKLKKDALKPQQYTCCAIGSRDRSLSIWLTALKRPLVVTHELFTNSILDISWGPCGTELLCCSCDGTVAYLSFKPEEIGTPLAKDKVGQLLENIYGKHITRKKNSTVIESAAILNLQQQQKVSPPRTGLDSVSRSSLLDTPSKSNSIFNGKDLGDSPFKPTDKQIETKTADGKRRITPIFLSCQPDVGELPVPFSHKISFDSSKQASCIQIEKQDKVTHSGLTSPPSHPQGLVSPTPPPARLTTDNKSRSPTSPTVTERVVDPGSRPRSPAMDKQQLSVQPMVALESRQATPRPNVPSPERPAERVGGDKVKAVSGLSLKRKADKDRDDQPKKRGRPRHTEREKERPRPTTPYNTPVIPPTQTPVMVDREPVRYIPTSSGLQLPVPSIDKHHSRKIWRGAGDGELTLVVENGAVGGPTPLHRLECTRAGSVVWQQVVASRIIAIAGTSSFAACGCEDSTLSVFNSVGQKILPSVCLSAPISIFEANGHYLMAITSSGSLYVWNMQTNSGLIRNEQLSGLLKGDDQIEKATVTRDGIPMVTLTDSRTFSYCTDMACWLLLYDKSDRLQHCSDHRSSTPAGASRGSGILASLQHTQDRPAGPASLVFQAGQNVKQLSTLNHLETQVAATLRLKSAAEYRFWLETYVRYLVQEGVESRLREVCNDLLGPVYRSKSTSSSWNKTVLGINKREFLKEILPYFGTNLSMQRLYTEIQEQLDTAVT